MHGSCISLLFSILGACLWGHFSLAPKRRCRRETSPTTLYFAVSVRFLPGRRKVRSRRVAGRKAKASVSASSSPAASVMFSSLFCFRLTKSSPSERACLSGYASICPAFGKEYSSLCPVRSVYACMFTFLKEYDEFCHVIPTVSLPALPFGS